MGWLPGWPGSGIHLRRSRFHSMETLFFRKPCKKRLFVFAMISAFFVVGLTLNPDLLYLDTNVFCIILARNSSFARNAFVIPTDSVIRFFVNCITTVVSMYRCSYCNEGVVESLPAYCPVCGRPLTVIKPDETQYGRFMCIWCHDTSYKRVPGYCPNCGRYLKGFLPDK